LNLVTASSGFEAIEALERHDFAVILLDVQMPGIDGFETARRIKMDERFRGIPIIFVTAINKDDSYVYHGYDVGAVDYVFKPFDAHILRSKVSIFTRLFLSNRQLERQAEIIRESERRERYLRLAEIEVENLKRYRNLADSIPHIVWRSKPDGSIEYFNRKWTETTGLSEEQSLGSRWQSVFAEEDFKTLLKNWIAAMSQPKPFQTECRIFDQSGQWRWHLIRAVPEVNLEGELIAWLGTCTDVHERKCIEEKLIEARYEAERANRTKTNFLANMSHEIRTPLNSILGFTDLLFDTGASEAERISSVATIKRNGQQLLKIVDELLDLAKVEADHLEIEPLEVRLDSLIGDLDSLLRIQADQKEIGFSISGGTHLPESVIIDPTRYRQILVNVIGNAIKFTHQGKVSASFSWHPLSADTSHGQGVLRCVITDTGIGIDVEQAKRIFHPFVQADSSTTRRFGGTGLGLALSRRLANALGGDVRLEKSEIGQGSVFVVDVQAQSRLAPHQSVGPASTEVAVGSAPRETGRDDLSNVKVLVVDDAVDNRTLITRFLKGVGATVEQAEDGVEGVKKAMSHEYDVVLMDIQMPEMDGYEAASSLREKGYQRPIIALTAHAMKDQMERSLRAGCDDHLTKPIDRLALVKHVARYARKPRC
jgi:PAS domain S-box-containing protein